uniref:Uncharacterized protein n=1 Tax=Anguilla anguilla TaxID=7936 RepID=A0A0E9U5N4_ANGAN
MVDFHASNFTQKTQYNLLLFVTHAPGWVTYSQSDTEIKNALPFMWLCLRQSPCSCK